MIKPVCVPCGLFFKLKKIGTTVEELMPRGYLGDSVDDWAPYKLWQGDLYACRGCGAEIVAGFGIHPISEHYKEDYQRIRDAMRPLVSVKDC